jgi:hypothetical protein
MLESVGSSGDEVAVLVEHDNGLISRKRCEIWKKENSIPRM